MLILGATRAGAATLVGFVLARTLVNLARQIVTMLSIALGVETAHDHHRGETTAVVRSLFALGRVAVAMTVAGSAAILLLGEGFVALWTGRPELFDRQAAAWLCAGAIVAAVTTPLATLLVLVDELKPAAISRGGADVDDDRRHARFSRPSMAARARARDFSLGELVGAALVLPRLVRRASLALDCRAYASDCLGAAANDRRLDGLRRAGRRTYRRFEPTRRLPRRRGAHGGVRRGAVAATLPAEMARAKALAFARPSRSS